LGAEIEPQTNVEPQWFAHGRSLERISRKLGQLSGEELDRLAGGKKKIAREKLGRQTKIGLGRSAAATETPAAGGRETRAKVNRTRKSAQKNEKHHSDPEKPQAKCKK
jgi:hypothetical protein